MAQQLPIQDAWTRARDRFAEDLTEAEKQIYYKASLEMIYYDASAAQKRHEEVSTSKHLVDKLQPLVSAIDQYAEALDVYANVYPLALSPLWGSLRIVLHVSSPVFMTITRFLTRVACSGIWDVFRKALGYVGTDWPCDTSIPGLRAAFPKQ